MMVSLYPNPTVGKSADIDFREFLAGIRAGRWDAQVLPVRALYRSGQPCPAYDQAKRGLPGIAASGVFADGYFVTDEQGQPVIDKRSGKQKFCTGRTLKDQQSHSGFVYLDLDRKHNPGMDVAALRAQVQADSYTYACHLSLSGDGLAVAFRVPTEDPYGSFRALAAYYKQRYGVTVDSLPDPTRLRFASSDPDLYLNEQAATFEETLAEPKARPVAARVPQLAAPVAAADLRSRDLMGELLAIGVRIIQQSGEGNKHNRIRAAGRTVGGYVASGFVDEAQAWDELWAAVLAKEGVADLHNAETVLRWGLDKGQQEPLLPERFQRRVREQVREAEQDFGTVVEVAQKLSALTHVPLAGIQAAVERIADEQRQQVPLLTFWDVAPKSEKRDAPLRLNLKAHKLSKWLGGLGFRQRSMGEKTKLVRIEGQVVRPLVRSRLKAFVLDYVESLPYEFDGVYRDDLEEAVQRQHASLFTEESRWEFLPYLEDADFVRDTAEVARLFFRDQWVHISSTQVEPRPYGELPGLVWESQVRDRDFPLLALEEMQQAEYYRYLWNVTGHKQPRFDSAQLLIGYYLHGYKDPSLTKIGVLVDELSGLDGQANGGTGKSLFFKALGEIVEVCEVDGKGYDPRNGKALQLVTDATRVIFFNDWDAQRTNFDRLFNMASDTLNVDRLYSGQQSYPFDISPKLGITTNGVLTGKDGSRDRRRFEVEVAPYYRADFQPRDEFGHNFFGKVGTNWSAEEWARFDNFMVYCCHLYLKSGCRLSAPASPNLERRRLIAGTSQGFVDFMDGQQRGVKLYRDTLISEFRVAEGYDERGLSPQVFAKWLAQYQALSTDFESGRDGGGGKRWIMLAQDTTCDAA